MAAGSKFLALSKELDMVIKELAGEDDDECVMLDCVVGRMEGMIMTPAAEPRLSGTCVVL